MNERRPPLDADFTATLPPELRDLDRELSAIRIEERESFGPELEGELLRVWRIAPSEGSRPSSAWKRTLIAACVACLMIGGMAVPAARASVARLVRNVLEEAAPRLFAPAEEPRLPEIRVAEPDADLPPEATGDQSASDPLAGLDESEVQQEGASFSEIEYSYPEILFREEARNIIASFYPTALQQAGVGGSVKLQLWVDASGRVDHIQMREGSGYQSLNLAAMRAATQIRFRPATRAGMPVGTWVEFTVNFVPGDQQGGGQPDSSPREGPGA
ncbi:MAG: energy transducer TonB [Gemmatimonadota bacterium]